MMECKDVEKTVRCGQSSKVKVVIILILIIRKGVG